MVTKAFHVLTGWENQYGGKQHEHEWNDTFAFSKISDRNEHKKYDKKQETGHYLNEFEEELPKGSGKKKDKPAGY